MPTLDEIAAVESQYLAVPSKPSLGRAFDMLRVRWSDGHRDRETALRLVFLFWYACAEPSELTGLPAGGFPNDVFEEAFETLGGAESRDAEVCFVVGLMAHLCGYCFGPTALWEVRAKVLSERAKELNPAGFKPEQFQGRGAFGEYFAMQTRGAG